MKSELFKSAMRSFGLSSAAADRVAQYAPRGIMQSGNCPRELAQACAIPLAQARRVVAALQLASVAPHETASIRGPAQAAAAARACIAAHGSAAQENLVTIAICARNLLIDARIVAIGTASTVSVHPRDVFRFAVRSNAIAIVVAHNHPSGVAAPSEADWTLTERLRDAGRIVGIPLVDHLILGDREDYSFGASTGLLTE